MEPETAAAEESAREDIEPVAEIEAEAETEAPEASETVTSAGYEDTPAQPRQTEHVLGKTWGIVPEILVELSSRTAIQADGEIEAAVTRRPTIVQPTMDTASVAVIPLCGVISPRGSLLARLFGYSSGLEGFREDFREALADDNVSAIVIDVDSPGGLIDQVTETAAEIFGARGTKPIVAVANTMCASAAYWIACQADELVVTPSGQVGSIGVFTVHEDVSQAAQAMGIKTTIVTAGRFKTEGNPYEPLSKQALQAMQSNVDDIYAMFTTDIARARGIPVQAVTAGYGEGRVVLASTALALKMVDRIETLEQTLTRLGAAADDMDVDDDMADMDDDDDDLTPDEDEPEIEAAVGSQTAAAADYLSSALHSQPPWQIGASRPTPGGRL